MEGRRSRLQLALELKAAARLKPGHTQFPMLALRPRPLAPPARAAAAPCARPPAAFGPGGGAAGRAAAAGDDGAQFCRCPSSASSLSQSLSLLL